ncbi:hypothetical protein L8V23_00025 [Corynebacterium sp. c6VSa_13]|uniref:hypothetical protein n=1 Tax=Corynebacterium sp. c6VSa_13 TaxID=2913496 RepID=UPI0022BA26EE|nr:hypothetical protein [Corynebacterium sp. c6VSa_13]MCZ9308158.1 hypothetical protein [Corynebacterium sp. c6VSa_13]
MHLASEQAAGTTSAAPGQENPDDLFDLVEGEAVDSGHVAAGGSGATAGMVILMNRSNTCVAPLTRR